MNFLCLGVNVRDLAASIKGMGGNVYAVNYFNSQDIHSYCEGASCYLGKEEITTRLLKSAGWKEFLVKEALKILTTEDIDYIVSRINNEVIDPLKDYAPLIGNSLEYLETPRDKYRFFLEASKAGINVPKTHLLTDDINVRKMVFPLIIKPRRGSRGEGVMRITSTEELEERIHTLGADQSHIIQQEVKGISYNANLISDGREVKPFFVSRQLFDPQGEFTYMGNIGPQTMPGLDETMCRYSRFLERFRLRGIMGVDFIVDGSGSYHLIDMNPRLQGSFEVAETAIDVNLFTHHFSAWKENLQDIPFPRRFAGKMILSAPWDCIVGDLSGYDFVHDIPWEGASVTAGEPLCTIISQGNSQEIVEERLRKEVKRIFQRLSRAVQGNSCSTTSSL